MMSVDPWTTETFDLLYEIFEQDFKMDQPTYSGRAVWFFPEMEDGKEKIFWHLTQKEDQATRVRLPDCRRSERLPWVRPMINNATDPAITTWDYPEARGKVNTYIWLKNWDFLVLLKKYPDGRRRLLTSYYIEYSNYRRKLEKKYEARVQ